LTFIWNFCTLDEKKSSQEDHMAQPSYQLVMHSGPTPGKVFPMEKNELFIGRDLTNDIVVNDAEVSRRHARLVLLPEGFTLEDLGSTNGTFVNGQRLAAVFPLNPGETITLGEHVTLVYEQTVIDPEATVATSSASLGFPPAPPAPRAAPIPAPVQPVMQAPPAPMPVQNYAGQVPQSPAMPVEPPAKVKKSKRTIWIILIIVLLLICCVCVGVAYYIDSHSLWCTVMPFIPGCK
jgi:pSer/pThr/pTyr-binding forkhead associated (FHA) protein